MAKIHGLEGLTYAELDEQLARGARFVLFEYCISVVLMTFKRGSDVYFIRAGEGVFVKSLPYSLISLTLGWWGIPWGPIYTLTSLFTNLGGGKNVTPEVAAMVRNSPR